MDTENNILKNIQEEIKTTQILIRTNNLLLSRFIMQLQEVRKEFNLTKKKTYFKFELNIEDYEELVNEFGAKDTDKALYKLDRLLLLNKQEIPHNIKKYIIKKLRDKDKKNNDRESNI